MEGDNCDKMIITKTPFRISFFGGGTDYPAWYMGNGGLVISTTIDKYCYISCRLLPQFFDYKHRIVYSKTETAKDINQIIHPAVRETFRFMRVKEGLEIHHDGDLPARSGLGSSSSFTVGLLNSLYALNGQMITKHKLAKDAIYIEQEMIKENVGSQDQVAVAYGGFNKIEFNTDSSFKVNSVIMNRQKLENLQQHLMLFFTGFARTASVIAQEQLDKIREQKIKKELSFMHQLAEHALSILVDSSHIDEFGKLLHESWILKRSMSQKISNEHIDSIYTAAIEAGALGGKILGAGGGGFMLIFAEPDKQERIRERLKDLLLVNFKFEEMGSQVVLYSPNGL